MSKIDMQESRNEQQIVQEIVNGIRDNRCLIFLGTRFSAESDVPTHQQLAKWLDGDATETLEERARVLVLEGRREWLNREVAKLIRQQAAPPSRAHRLLARMQDCVRLVVTTNIDGMLATAYQNWWGPDGRLHIVRPGGDKAEWSSEGSNLFEICGCIEDCDTLVLARQDHEEFVSRKNESLCQSLAELFKECSILVLIGFGEPDERFHALYNRLLREYNISDVAPTVYTVGAAYERMDLLQWGSGGIQRKAVAVSDGIVSFLESLSRELYGFSNREKEIELISIECRHPITVFTGTAGIGKTMLLHKLAARQKRAGRAVAFIDFSVTKQTVTQIRDEIYRQLRPVGSEKSDQALVNFLSGSVVTLFFDAIEQASEEALVWIGEIVSPALLRSCDFRLQVVFGGRGDPSSFSARPWEAKITEQLGPCVEWKLRPLSRPDVRKQIWGLTCGEEVTRLGDAMVSRLTDSIFRVSNGHPGIVKALVEVICEWEQEHGRISPREFEEREEYFVKGVYDRVFADRQFATFGAEQIQDFLVLAIPRLYMLNEIEELRKVFPSTQGKRVKGIDLFQWMNGTKLVTCHESGWSSIDEPLRRFLARYLEYEDSGKYFKALEIMRDFYFNAAKNSANRMDSDWAILVIEWLYYFALILKREERLDEEAVKNKVESALSELMILDQENTGLYYRITNRLYENLKRDNDIRALLGRHHQSIVDEVRRERDKPTEFS